MSLNVYTVLVESLISTRFIRVDFWEGLSITSYLIMYILPNCMVRESMKSGTYNDANFCPECGDDLTESIITSPTHQHNECTGCGWWETTMEDCDCGH